MISFSQGESSDILISISDTEVNVMSGTITARVDFSALESYIAKLETAKDEYMATYTNDLYSNVMEEVKGAYAGVDCDAFVQKVEGFRDDFTKLSDVLQQYIDHLRKVLADYRATQDALLQKAKSQAESMSL